MEDAEAIWRWRHEGNAWRFFKNPEATALETHLDWFRRAENPERIILVARVNQTSIGYVRFDRVPADAPVAEISVCLAAAARGRGYGRGMIAAAVAWAGKHGLLRLDALVHPENTGSLKAFEGNEFVRGPVRDGFLCLSLGL